MRARLAVVGMGPGDRAHMTPAAAAAIGASEALVGYGRYLDLLGDLAAGKARHETGLGAETERAERALDLAAAGRPTALVSSGDPGVYAMATLVFERLAARERARREAVAIEVVPGVSAMQVAAARAGAPLGHDFCAISLSDLLTPWAVIERRIQAAAWGDFVIAFYNPRSQRRCWQLGRAAELLRGHRPGDTPVTIGRNLARADERVTPTTLDALAGAEVDMLSLVIVGNSQTRRVDDRIYTPRGYAAQEHPA